MDLPVQFGKYRLDKFLGGGMSHVFRATDTVLDRTVAVKILTDAGCQDEDAKKRFLLEARMSGNIIHDNVIRIHDYGEERGRPFIVMEFLVGEDLSSAIKARNTGDLKNQLDIAIQAARAISYVHTHDIVHRDLKPENLHIDTKGRVRLMDFGIAKSANLSLTREGFALGTPYYMAPEQVMGKPVTPVTDVYAFGIVLYELFTGIKPVVGETVESLFYLILQQPLNLDPLKEANLPEELVQLIARMTSKPPEQRPSIEEVVTALEGLRSGLDAPVVVPTPPSRPSPEPVPPKPSRLLPLLAVLGAVILTAVIAAIWIIPWGSKNNVKNGGDNKEVTGPPATITDEFGEMVLVPQGTFLFGPDKQPMDLPAFYIDKTEVSVGMWNKFCQALNRKPRVGVPDEYPITDVTLDEASSFARWANKQIPTDEQWEKAARGTDGRTYPWGNDDDPTKANVAGNPNLPEKQVQPVASLPAGASPFGALNMAGNVAEWMREVRAPTTKNLELFEHIHATADEPWTTVRGGEFDYPLPVAVTYEELVLPARAKGPTIGFRCVRPVH